MPRLQRESLFNGVEFLNAPAERLQTAGEIRPDRRLVRIRSRRAAEQQLRLIGGAARQHAHAQLIEHCWMIRRALRHVRQQLVGFRHAARGLFGLGGLQNADDRCFVERCGGSGIHAVIV